MRLKNFARGIQSRSLALLIELYNKADKSFWKSRHQNREIYIKEFYLFAVINFNEGN